MPRHHYRIRVEYLGPDGEAPAAPVAPLEFRAASHDEIIGLRQKVSRQPLSEDETTAMLVGLKLLGEVTMQYRKTAPFDRLFPALRYFIGALKGATPRRKQDEA